MYGYGWSNFCSNIILAIFIVVSKVILVPCSVTVRNDMVGMALCGTERYVEKRYGWCGTLQVGGEECCS